MAFLSITDFFLVPAYIYVIFIFFKKFRDKHYPLEHRFHKYFIPGLVSKISGALAICFIYLFYFGFGDTLNYYSVSTTIREAFFDDIGVWWRLVTHSSDINNLRDSYYLSIIGEQNYILQNFIVSIIGSIVGLFCFNSFLCISIVLAAISFTGLWALFIAFEKLYPNLTKGAAIAALFIPSVVIWGSGLFKDTICMFCLGWLIYCYYKLFQKFSLKSLIVFCAACWLIFLIKPYILASILPLLLVSFILTLLAKMKNIIFKSIALLIMFLVMGKVYNSLFSSLSNNVTDLIIENFASNVSNFSNANLRISMDENGSGYSLGELDGSARDLASKIPAAINVTFYRPYLWEAKKPITFIAALESLALLGFSVYLIVVANFKIIKYLFKDKNLLIFFLFSIILGYMVGLTSANFGTLNRFKIPCMPFFLMFLFIIHHKYKAEKNIYIKTGI